MDMDYQERLKFEGYKIEDQIYGERNYGKDQRLGDFGQGENLRVQNFGDRFLFSLIFFKRVVYNKMFRL